MLALGPIAYHDDQKIHWLQIIIGDSGICSEIKQASETEIVTNSWKTLDQSQWPSTIPVYDPAASQSHYILTRSAENKISKHMVSKVNLPQSPTADDQNPPPIYRVSNQTYSRTHIGAPTIIKDQEQTVRGAVYRTEVMVAIAMKRLNEHEVAIVHSLPEEQRKQHLQLRSAGELGTKLALEIECLQAASNGARKLQRIKNALNHLPEKLSSADLHAELRNKTSPLAQAVYSPIAPTTRGFTFFTAKKLPEPDFAFLKEMDAYLDKMDETLSTKIRPNSTEPRL